ncbi:MAG: DUF1501 domain-containing protein, partial [Planctomycetota bacterium]
MLDIVIGQSASRRCDGQSRRDILRAGGLGALSLPTLLRMEAATAADNPGARAPARAGRGPRAKSVILVFLGGGLSHHDSFDLKSEAPEEIRGKYKPISSVIPGLQVGEKLPRMASLMDKITLVRSG